MGRHTSTARKVAAIAATCAAVVAGTANAAWAGKPACRKASCPTTDAVAPSVAVSTPAPGATVSGAVRVAGTASDAAGVRAVDVSVDGGAWSPATGTTSWAWSWGTAGLANGTHTLRARATDTSGNAAVASVTVTVANTTPDTTPPAVAISGPAAGSTVAGTVTVWGTASDAGGVARVDVSVDGGPPVAASGTASWTWSWDTSTVGDGAHTVVARAVDAAGNPASTAVTVTVANAPAPAPPPSGGSSTAPDTQGTWVSPEGVTIEVASAGPWTIRQIHRMLVENAAGAGDFARIAPSLKVKVQDATSSHVTISSTSANGTYTSASPTIWLKGVNSTFSVQPDAQLAHEYGHAWTLYHLYLDRQLDWSSYLAARWTAADGSVTLATDPRLESSYVWAKAEIIADDYRLLFGSSLAVSQRNAHMNPDIADPRNVPGLRDFLLTRWTA